MGDQLRSASGPGLLLSRFEDAMSAAAPYCCSICLSSLSSDSMWKERGAGRRRTMAAPPPLAFCSTPRYSLEKSSLAVAAAALLAAAVVGDSLVRRLRMAS